MSIISLAAIDAAPLEREPFDFLVVTGAIDPETIETLNDDYPDIDKPANFDPRDLEYGPSFQRLLEELDSQAFEDHVAAKFGVDLKGAQKTITVRKYSESSDGHIHTDHWSKIVTLLVYFNPQWHQDGGRFRILRSPTDIEDYRAEVPPLGGTVLAFRRCGTSYHGYKRYEGERRMVQMSWVRPSRPAWYAQQTARFFTAGVSPPRSTNGSWVARSHFCPQGVVGQRAQVLADPVAADFQASMVFVDLLVKVMSHCGEIPGRRHREEVLDALLQRALVALEAEHIVAALGDDLRGDGALTPHRIDGDDAALELKELQQFGDGGDLVGFFLGGLLAQHQTIAARPSADHVQRRAPSAPIPRTARALPIHRDDLPAGGRGNRLRPTAEARPEPLRSQARDNPGNAVMRGHAVVEPSELTQPVKFCVAELLDRLPTRRPADDRADRQQHDIKQGVALVALDPRIFKGGEML